MTQSNDSVELSESEWRERLGSEEYHICREQGTERAFSGKYWNTKDDGVYRCRGCDAPLFDSASKFDSGTGWPSFFEPMAQGQVASELDRSHGMVRHEVHCAHCGCHWGMYLRMIEAKPTGQRYCINSASLSLQEREN